LRTGDGRLLPKHLKAQIGRELARLELLLEQIKAVEAERDALFFPVVFPSGNRPARSHKLRETGAVNAADRSLRPGAPR
jgi:hypothetical protein